MGICARFLLAVNPLRIFVLRPQLGSSYSSCMKFLFVRLLERLVGTRTLSPSDVDLGRIQRILVIRQHDMLGDFLLSTPVFQALRSKFPNAYIAVLVRDYFLDAILHHPCIDEILVLRKTGNQWNVKHIWRLLRRLIMQWDLTIVLNTVSHSLTSDLLAALSNRHYVLGSTERVLAGCSRNFFYNLLAPPVPAIRHQTDRNLDIVRYLGADTKLRHEQMHLTPAEVEKTTHTLFRIGLRRDHPVIGLHIGAGKVKNRWETDRFVELAEILHARHKATIILFWGAAEGELASRFRKTISFLPLCFPPGRLRELGAAFRNCDLVVCNDTGAMHVCAAVDVPLVAIFGPTDPNEWKPIGDRFVGVRSGDGTVGSVSVDQVYQCVHQLIAQTSEPRDRDTTRVSL
jgi:heptosyltransferase III